MHNLSGALDDLLTHRNESEVVFILPTYTLLFPLRDLLQERQKKAGLSQAQVKEHGEEASA